MIQVIQFVFNIFELLILARVLSTWIQVDPYNPIMQFIYRTTEPFLAPVRSMMAQTFPRLSFDFSPLVVLILATIVERILFSILGY